MTIVHAVTNDSLGLLEFRTGKWGGFRPANYIVNPEKQQTRVVGYMVEWSKTPGARGLVTFQQAAMAALIISQIDFTVYDQLLRVTY